MVRDLALSALNSDIIRTAATRSPLRESYVATELDDGTVLEGIVDLMYRDDDGTVVIVDYKTEILDHSQVAKMLPDIGPEVVGASYCPLDGHVNSLRLFRTLHTAINARGVTYLPSHRVENITKDGGEFRLHTEKGEVRAGKVALAAGNANMRLAPMVGATTGLLGVPYAVAAIMVAFITGGIWAIVLLAGRRVGLKTHLAFGPFMCLGALAATLLV